MIIKGKYLGNKSIFFIFFIHLVLNACSQERYSGLKPELELHLSKIVIFCPAINTDGWNIADYDNDSCSSTFHVIKNEQDTTMELSFIYFHKGNRCPFSDKYYFNFFSKNYSIGDTIYSIGFENCSDTLYYCKWNKTKEKEKEFIVGKYYWQSLRGQYSVEQSNYYLLKRDSLDKIRGNNLSDLPELKSISKSDSLRIDSIAKRIHFWR
ncbi:MAG: hypothetical protein Q8R96_04500 [Bacteroidota bacterium]|nr:hypothetical protein [Bacteroidota bacterium]